MSYLQFEPREPEGKRKTVIVDVVSVSSGTTLGEIRWHGPWRQFCFFPTPHTLFNKDCLREIADECSERTAARKMERSIEKANERTAWRSVSSDV